MKAKVGVIGTGSMGQNHVRVYAKIQDVDLVGIADINKERVSELAKEYKTRAYTDYEDLVDENLDAVSIAVPTTLHRKITLEVIQRGINVVIEKPIADTVEGANEIIKCAQQNGVKLMVGHIERFNPAIMKLKELIDRGELGDIISMSAKRVGPYNPKVRDVGIIVDLGTHDIDIMSYLCGERITEIYALAGNAIHGCEDHAIIVLSFSHDSSGVIDINWLTPGKIRNLMVVGSKGVAEVDYIQANLRVFDREWVRDAKIEKEEPLKLELQHFIECIRKDKQPLVSGETAKYALEVALAAVESYETGKVYEIK
jgi:UDP-N-acetylglucosamine 3-dehydrogenase